MRKYSSHSDLTMNIMHEDILTCIEQEYVIVTPTQGLAHHLHAKYAAQQIELGKQSWPSAHIVSWNVWLLELWQALSFELESAPILLSRHQSLLLWSNIIESSSYAKQLLQIDATARQAQAAYHLCKDWDIETIPDKYFTNQDNFAFKIWMESYELKCQKKNWLDQANILSFLELNFSQPRNTNKYVFYAFENLTPKQHAFLLFLKKQNLNINYLKPSQRNDLAEKISFEDELKEVNAIADWIIDCYEKQPTSKIGVVIPNLHAKKSIYEKELSKRLSIKQYVDGSVQNQLPFTISLGKALNEYPMISIALTILSLNNYRIDLDRFSLVLRSVFITGYEIELNQRCLLDAELRKFGQPFLRFETIMRIHDQIDDENQCPILIDILKNYFLLKQENTKNRSLREWSDIFAEYLKLFLWPGDEKLISDDYQTWESWQDCLQQFVSLNIISAKHDFYSSLNLLNNLCGQIQFQPKTEDKNIFIMGIEGASGMQFDYCWFATLDESMWPQSAIANPFLPYDLQRELEMPGGSANINLNHAKILTNSLIDSSKQIILSYSRNKDDSALRPSPLLKNIPFQKNIIDSKIGAAEKIFNQKSIQHIENDLCPKIGSDTAINGNSSLLKDQAVCPFRAFAKHRMNAESINHTEFGLDAIDRGIITHRVLQYFWEKVKHSNQLRHMSEQVLEQRIEEAASNVIEEQKQFLSELLGLRFIEIEYDRLCRVLRNWIQIEKQREAFTVEAVEKGRHILFNGITLHMRIDRIDRLEDGRLVIIDYKTGEISPNSWFGERPEDPQLPLYAITANDEVAGLAFAKLKIGDYRYLGVSDKENLIPKIKALPPQQWQQCLNDWQSILSGLAFEFREGNAIVDPIPGACRYCDLSTLCRINERIDVYMEEDE